MSAPPSGLALPAPNRTTGEIGHDLAIAYGIDQSSTERLPVDKTRLSWIEGECRYALWDKKIEFWRTISEARAMALVKGRLYHYRQLAQKIPDTQAAAQRMGRLGRLDNPGSWNECLRAFRTEDRASNTTDQWARFAEYVPTDVLLLMPRREVVRANPKASRAMTVPYTPDQLIRTRARVRYDETAACPAFDKYLLDICSGEVPTRDFLLRYFGYATSGYNDEDRILVLLGSGRNGKMTLVEAVRYVLGELAAQLEIEALLEKRATRPEYHLARLPGKRLVTVSELRAHRRINVSILKSLSGGGTVTGRFPAKNPFEFEFRGKLVIDANALPAFEGGSDAIKARIIVVNLRRNFVEEEIADPDLTPKLEAEASGILNQLINGYFDYCRQGLAVPAAVRGTSEGQMIDNDVIGEFLEASFTKDATGRVVISRLRELWAEWGKVEHLARSTADIDITRAVAQRPGVGWYKVHGVRGFEGLRERVTGVAGIQGVPGIEIREGPRMPTPSAPRKLEW